MKIKKKIIKNKLLFKVILALFISFIIGILYIAIISKNNQNMIKVNLNNYFSSINKLNYTKGLINCLSSNIITVILIWILGISIVGLPIIVFMLLFKSFSLGFSISSIIYFYKVKGIVLALIYAIPLIINLFLFFYISYYGITFSINLNKLLFFKKQINFRFVIKRYIKILIFTLFGIIISSVIEIYLIPFIFKLLQV